MAGMAEKDERGRAGEQVAADYLERRGYTILARNWRAPDGEIDLVATDGADLVVVEVKTRRSDGYGHPLEAVDERKRRRLWRLGVAWAAAHPDLARGLRLRLDAIGIVGEDAASGTLEHLTGLELA